MIVANDNVPWGPSFERPHAACDRRIAAAEAELADLRAEKERLEWALDTMSRIVCYCPNPNNPGIPTDRGPCPTHSSGRFARAALAAREADR